MTMANEQDVRRAARSLENGRLVGMPTETVYGLGARADDDRAIARIFEAKGRPTFNPLIVHCTDVESAKRNAVFDDSAERLAAAFWPGPLTMVLPYKKSSNISPLVRAGQPTIAVRCPAQNVASELLAKVGVPVAAPSANPSGRLSPTSAQHVIEGLASRIDAVLDDGPCETPTVCHFVG